MCTDTSNILQFGVGASTEWFTFGLGSQFKDQSKEGIYTCGNLLHTYNIIAYLCIFGNHFYNLSYLHTFESLCFELWQFGKIISNFKVGFSYYVYIVSTVGAN